MIEPPATSRRPTYQTRPCPGLGDHPGHGDAGMAMQESGLHNLPGGDGDSIGVLQRRAHHPQLAATAPDRGRPAMAR
jgi:hypothetical protein